MTKARMIEILLLAAENHKCGRSVCDTLRYLYDNGIIGFEEIYFVKDFVKDFAFTYFCNEIYTTKISPNLPRECYFLSEERYDFLTQEGTQQRINILLDAAMYVEVMGLE